jgi:hypothetical protein
VKVAGAKKAWTISVAIYTLAGFLASALVGGGLGAIGQLLLPSEANGVRLETACVIAVIALLREARLLSIPLLQTRRQTNDVWAKIFPVPVTAALWGFDLGLVFTTRLTFSGPWVLSSIALLYASPQLGAILFAGYWLGRAATVWTLPWLLPDPSATAVLLDGIAGSRALFQRIHSVGLAWSVAVLGMLAASN